MRSLNVKTKIYIVFGLTALVISRILLLSFNDEEGPNLLIVTTLAGVLYFWSTTIYSSTLLQQSNHKTLLAIFAQILLAIALYVLLTYL